MADNISELTITEFRLTIIEKHSITNIIHYTLRFLMLQVAITYAGTLQNIRSLQQILIQNTNDATI